MRQMTNRTAIVMYTVNLSRPNASMSYHGSQYKIRLSTSLLSNKCVQRRRQRHGIRSETLAPGMTGRPLSSCQNGFLTVSQAFILTLFSFSTLLMATGTCNLALFSFEDIDAQKKKILNASPALAWTDIFSACVQLSGKCLDHNQGGAVVVKGRIREPSGPSSWLAELTDHSIST